jgi:hypothetical protein
LDGNFLFWRFSCANEVPRTGDELSILGFGCMRRSQKKSGGSIQERAVRQLRFTIDQGVNYVDTLLCIILAGARSFSPVYLITVIVPVLYGGLWRMDQLGHIRHRFVFRQKPIHDRTGFIGPDREILAGESQEQILIPGKK